jgi:hypothetical protein
MREAFRTYSLSAVLSTWPLLALGVGIALLGVLTIHPFDGSASLAPRQLIWISVGILAYIACAITDMRFIRRTPVIVAGMLLP